MNEEKRTSVAKVIIISVTVAIAVVGLVVLLYNLFKKYFKVTIDCGNCDSCNDDSLGDDLDPCCESDEDFVPSCSLDEAEEA